MELNANYQDSLLTASTLNFKFDFIIPPPNKTPLITERDEKGMINNSKFLELIIKNGSVS